MKKYLFGLIIALAVGIALLLFFNQGLFTVSDGVTEPEDDAVEVRDGRVEPVEEEDTGGEEIVIVDALDEEPSGEESEPAGDETNNASDDKEFTVNDFPYQDFLQARSKGEPIVLKFYSET